MVNKLFLTSGLIIIVWGVVGVIGPINVQSVSAEDPKGFQDSVKQVRDNIAGSGSGLAREISAVQILRDIINWLLSLVAILALLALIIGGMTYILSIGNDSMTAKAKKMILYAIIGLLIVGLSFAVIAGVQSFLTGSSGGGGGGGGGSGGAPPALPLPDPGTV